MADKYVNASGISALKSYIDTQDNTKQDTLVSGTNIKTINNTSLLGSGNIDISGGSGDSDVFVATYGTTTYEEILDAIVNKKIIKLQYNINGIRYHQPIVYYYSASNTYHFAYARYGVIDEFLVDSKNNWKTISCNILGADTSMSDTSTNPVQNKVIKSYIDASIPVVDTSISDSSENAVQNKIIKSYIDKKYPPIQTQGNYKYRIYDDGTFEVWFKQTGYTITINNASGNLYRSPLTSLALPSNIYNNYTCNIIYASVDCGHNNYPAWGLLASIYDTGVNFYAMSGGSRSSSPNYTLSAYFWGTLTSK